MIHIGALMSAELVEDLATTLPRAVVTVVDLGSSVSGIRPGQTQGLQALVVELSDVVLDSDPRVYAGAPIAGIPVSALSDEVAARYAIDTVLRGPEDLERFVSGLTRTSEPGVVASGHIIAVWGAAGAPGRTTLAVATAALLATRSTRVVLIDADTYAPAISPVLGITSPQPGIIAAGRVARVDSCHSDAVVGCATPFTGQGVSFPVLTGLRSAVGFPDCPGSSWRRVLSVLREAGYLVVIDVAAPLEQFPHEVVGGPIRNAVTMASLEGADTVIAVARPDPLSVLRLSRSWKRFCELSPDSRVHTVLNALPPHSEASLEEGRYALWQFTGQEHATPIAHDRALAHPGDRAGDAVITSALRGVMSKALAPVLDPIAPPRVARVRAMVQPQQRRTGWPSGVSGWFPRAGKRLL